MIKAIVYKSKTGHTKRYAELFSQESDLPCYDMDEAAELLAHGDEIIMMGWLMAGSVKGYAKAARIYTVKAVCAVGGQILDQKVIDEIASRHKIENIPIYYFRGGYDLEKLTGPSSLVIKSIAKALNKAAAKPNAKPDVIEAAKSMQDGTDFVSKENLSELISWYKEHTNLS